MKLVSCKQCKQKFLGTPQHRYCSETCQRLRKKADGVNFKVQIKRRYGLTFEMYTNLLKAQDGKCAICGVDNSQSFGKEKLCIDHSHSTGIVRGILCHKCNIILGFANDDPKLLRKAVDYLESGGILPTYEFQCVKCRKTIEIQRSIKDESTPLCMEPGCDGQQEMEQIISKTSFSLKGNGWASDGYSKAGVD